MVLPAHSKGLPVFSSQFAFLAVQSLTCRPRSRKTSQPTSTAPDVQSSRSLVQSVQRLTLWPKRKAKPADVPESFDIIPDNYLPSELLHIIFTFALEPSSTELDLEERNALRATILACSQVNQQWRLAARDCRILWIHALDFQFQPLEVIADLLPLSRPHPIDIGQRSAPFRVHDRCHIAILDLLKSEAHRIREWNIEFAPASKKLKVKEGWTFPSTNQSSVTTLRYKGGEALSLWSLSELSPTLRKLSIRDPRGFQPLELAMNFASLTELLVSSISMRQRPAEADWLQMLQGMPQLQLLALHNAVRHDLLPTAPPLFDIWLPQLRLVSLHDTEWIGVSAQRRLWSHLRVPDTCGTEMGFPSTTRAGRLTILIQPLMDRLRRQVRERIGGFAAMTSLTSGETPQIEISVRSTPTGCQLALGTVRHPDLTLDWNGDQGTSGVMEYLNVHASMFPKFPPVNIVFNGAAVADVNHVFDLTCDIFWKATSVKVHVDSDTSADPSVRHIASALPSLLSRMPQINVLKLDKGSAKILNGLFLLLPSPRHSFSPQKQLDGVLGQSYVTVLPKLQRIVLEMDHQNAVLGQSDAGGQDGAEKDEVDKYAEWRKNCGYPVDVVRR